MVVWNFLGGVISASRVGGSDLPSSKQHAVLARGTAGTPLISFKLCKGCLVAWMSDLLPKLGENEMIEDYLGKILGAGWQ